MNYNHGGKVVARLRNKTLVLTITDRGLDMEADLSGTAAAGDYCMAYGKPLAYQLDLFGPYTVEVSHDYKFAEGLLAVMGEALASALAAAGVAKSVKEIADALMEAAAGFETSMAKVSTKTSAAGFTEASTAVDVLTTAINAYKLEGSEAERVAFMLIKTQDEGKTSVGGMRDGPQPPHGDLKGRGRIHPHTTISERAQSEERAGGKPPARLSQSALADALGVHPRDLI